MEAEKETMELLQAKISELKREKDMFFLSLFEADPESG